MSWFCFAWAAGWMFVSLRCAWKSRPANANLYLIISQIWTAAGAIVMALE